MNILIIGASSGIGKEVSLLFLRNGHRVAMCARRIEPLEEIRRQFPDKSFVKQIDVNDCNSTSEFENISSETGDLDCIFNVAGIGWQNRALDSEKELLTVETNVEGFTRTIDWAFHYFASLGIKGHIGVISSIAGTKGLGPAPAYSASKAYQNTYVQALSQLSKIKGLGITFTDVRPGFVDTPLLGDGNSYPMLLKPEKVAKHIYKALLRRKRVCIIDWKYRVLVFFWRLIPNFLWYRLKI